MKVSIIIPVYNVEQFIKECILSILNQTFRNIEIILVNDCCTDDSIQIAKNVISNHKNGELTTIINHETNQGVSAARNTGINAATGGYIYFVDSDDSITPNCIELLAKIATKFKSDFIVSDYQISGTDQTNSLLKLNEGFLGSNAEILSTYLDRNWYMMPWNKLFKRSFLINNKLFFKEGIVHEDELWSFILACKANTAYITKSKTYTYNVHPGSITQSPSMHTLESTMEVIGNIVDFVKKDKKLRSNLEIYNYIEGMKSMFFFNILASDFKNDLMYSSYKKIRDSKYINTLLSFSRFKLNFQRTIRNIHYLLPTYLGFIYYRELLFYKSRVDYNKGKFS